MKRFHESNDSFIRRPTVKRNLMVLGLMVLLVTSLWAWNYNKAVTKYLTTHPNSPPIVTAAFAEKTLLVGLEMDAAIIIAKELSGWNWMKELKSTECQDEAGQRTVVVEVFYENRVEATGLVERTTFITMTFSEGLLVKWTLTIPK